MHLPFVAAAPLYVLTRHPGLPPGDAILTLLAALGLGALQLRHSLASARGERPRAWPWSLAALMVLAYLPAYWFPSDWAGESQWFVLASAAMLLRPRLAVLIAAVSLITTSILLAISLTHSGSSDLQAATWAFYWTAVLLMGGAALFGSARLARVLDQLYAARTEIAERELGRERLRMSRDLHDLLGHSLSAVSLKGDLAMRLLPNDAQAASREIESLTDVARTALRDMRAVTRDEHRVSLRTELDAARSVLDAAGVQTRVDVALPSLPEAVDAVLAWAVREGATNILRHSEALACTVAARREDGQVRLEMVNDGAPCPAGPLPGNPAGKGSGLAGLARRVRALGGTAAGERLTDGRFRLLVEIPEGAP